MSHILEIDGVQLEFGQRRILSDVYVRADTGRITGLLGRNGSGKSCFMQIAFGTMPAYSRSVRCNGRHVPKAFLEKGLLNYLPQFYFIPPGISVHKALRCFGINADAFIETFPEYKADLYKTMSSLSGGQRRLIEIYVVIKAQTRFTILDEPFSHIMPLHVDRIKLMIQEVKTNKGFIITDHMYRHIVALSDDLYLLNNGKTHLIKEPGQLVQYGYLSGFTEL